MRIDLHNHTPLCKHAEGKMEDFILKAIEKKIDIFGFSDHAPMNFDQKYRMKFNEMNVYEQEIERLKNKYRDKIKIKKGYEVDYLENHMDSRVLKSDVDYLIGSVHFINSWGFDNPEFIGEYKNKNIDKIYKQYFNIIEKMAKSRFFDIVGHIDLIKVFNFLPKRDISKEIKNSLKEIKKSGMSIELNPAGFRKPINEQYPSREILNMAYKLKIPITFGSDAHKIDQIGFNYEKLIDLAKSVGYKECVAYSKREIISIKLTKKGKNI